MHAPVLVLVDRPAGGDGPGPASRLVDARAPQLAVTDLAVTRGDGVFETAAVRHGVVQSAERHLARFARSAALLDLPVPDPDVYRAACAQAVAALGDLAADGFVKYVLSRGDEESPDGARGWVYADAAPDHAAERRDGVAVVLLDRGYALDVPRTAPWLLQGAKTLSYAVNKAALREAARRGAQDVVFTTTDGHLLEGPTSTLVLRRGRTLVTPRPDAGVLDGTTQADVFAAADALGVDVEVRDVRVEELAAADAAWLMSSVRLAVPVRAVDGVALAVDADLTARVNALLVARTS